MLMHHPIQQASKIKEIGNPLSMLHERCHRSNAGTRKLKKSAWRLSRFANDQVISFGENLLLVEMITSL